MQILPLFFVHSVNMKFRTLLTQIGGHRRCSFETSSTEFYRVPIVGIAKRMFYPFLYSAAEKGSGPA
jgi:hypothetical protein